MFHRYIRKTGGYRKERSQHCY
uniref:Uncharacterized protein n=1 Tax=Anguilla anguilla TaxID=7936 RepID=A0A0E9RWL2_ANGAN